MAHERMHSRMQRINIKDLEPISATDAKIRFGELLHRTSVDNEIFVVNRQGRPVAVVLSYKHYSELIKNQKA
jgi:prevent-host-death family protein